MLINKALICVLFVCLIFLLFLFYMINRYYKRYQTNNLCSYEYETKRNTLYINGVRCSVFILNYNRPHNVYKQIDKLVDNVFIQEIIISNGHPDYVVKSDYTSSRKIRIIDDFELNSKYYAARRCLGIKNECRNELVLSLDDDVIPSNELIIDLLYLSHSTPYNIYGPIKRRCDKYGYKTYVDNIGYNYILTPICMISKKLIVDFVEEEFKNKVNWIKKYKGNGEDLMINLYLLDKGIKPVYVPGLYKWLDNSNGYSSKDDHYKVRSMFCTIYSSNYDKVDYDKIHVGWLYNFVDSSYIITLDKRKSYVEYIMSLMKIDNNIFPAIDESTLNLKELYYEKKFSKSYYYGTEINSGRVACHFSHLAVLKKFENDPLVSTCLIMEDDIKLPYKMMENINYFKKVMENVPSDWDIIYIGKCYCACNVDNIVNRYITKDLPLCLHAYIVNKRGARKIIENSLPMIDNGDKMYKKMMMEGKLIGYSSIIPLFFQNREVLGTTLGNTKLKICSDGYESNKFIKYLVKAAKLNQEKYKLFTGGIDYKLGYVIRFRDTKEKKCLKTLLNHHNNYYNTIAGEYMRKTGKKENYDVLYEIIKDRRLITELDVAKKNTIVIHLRVGDVIEYCEETVTTLLSSQQKSRYGKYVRPLSYYKKYMDKLNKYDINEVIFVAGSHKDITYDKSNLYISCIMLYFRLHCFFTSIRAGKPYDEDFLFMSNAKYFLPSGGGFSQIIAKMVEMNGNIVLS